ncbi:hypothetical protein KI387_005415, partial [Taxus chinensis]
GSIGRRIQPEPGARDICGAQRPQGRASGARMAASRPSRPAKARGNRLETTHIAT